MLYLLLINFTFATTLDLNQQQINCLINKVRVSKAVFIRNSSEHKSSKAADHIQMKYQKAVNTGWPFYKKREVSTSIFIEEIASHSSFSGKPYKMKLNNKVVLVKDWLHKQLKKSCRID